MLYFRSLLIAGLMGLCSSPLYAVGEWPQFRGPTGQGISTATGIPVEWSSTKNVAWKTEIPGAGWSSPVLSAGKLYLTSFVGKDDAAVSLRAICVDAASGTVLWNTEVFQPDPKAAKKMHSKNTPASSTPIVTDDRLYVHFGHMGTAALDLSGKIIWQQTSIKYSPVHGNGGSPMLVDGKLIFTCDGGSNLFVCRGTRTPRPVT